MCKHFFRSIAATDTWFSNREKAFRLSVISFLLSYIRMGIIKLLVMMAQCWSHILSTSTEHSIINVDEGSLLRLVHVLRSREMRDFSSISRKMTNSDVVSKEKVDPI